MIRGGHMRKVEVSAQTLSACRVPDVSSKRASVRPRCPRAADDERDKRCGLETGASLAYDRPFNGLPW